MNLQRNLALSSTLLLIATALAGCSSLRPVETLTKPVVNAAPADVKKALLPERDFDFDISS
jgi:hypothetical protein